MENPDKNKMRTGHGYRRSGFDDVTVKRSKNINEKITETFGFVRVYDIFNRKSLKM